MIVIDKDKISCAYCEYRNICGYYIALLELYQKYYSIAPMSKIMDAIGGICEQFKQREEEMKWKE